MGGFAGIGGSGAKTDRGAQLGARQGLWNVFNTALPEGQAQEKAGISSLGGAEQYWRSLLTGGRTQTAQNAAPAIQATLASGDAARRAEGTMGTGRTGGTAAINREAGAGTTRSIEDTISQALTGGRAAGAKGLESTAAMRLTNASNLMGLGTGAVEDILSNATESGQFYTKQQAATGQAIAEIAMALAMA